MSKQISNHEELLSFMQNYFADLEIITQNNIFSLAQTIEALGSISFNSYYLFNECEQIIKTSPKKIDFFLELFFNKKYPTF